MSQAKICVVGSSGRMGQEIINILSDEVDFIFKVGVARTSAEFSDISKVNAMEVDLVIDFSLPEVFDSILTWCLENDKALVSGTTGLNEKQLAAIEKAGGQIPILWAPNMSVGVAVLENLISGLKSIKDDFDFQIEELHHSQKKDAPSGTALFLQERLEESVERELPKPVSIRGGGIFGVHKVFAMSQDEVITIEHNALNRSVFAKGAVRAAKWLLSKPPGQYHMRDIISGK